jgi:hypothetical protein
MKVYSTSESRPVIENVPDPACTKIKVSDPGVDIAVYDSIVAPPLLAGAEKVKDVVVVPVAVAVPIVGAPGAVTVGVSPATAMVIVAVPVSVAFTALTEKTVEASVSVGVPAILPLEVLNVSPAGNVGVIDQLLAVPPVFVAVTAVIAVLMVAETDAVLKVILGASRTVFTVTVVVADAAFALPELSRTVPAPTLKVKLPVVAETDDSRIV